MSSGPTAGRRHRGLLKISFVLGTFLAAGLVAASVVSGADQPSVASDQPDYAPGAPVALAGSGWQPGEAVHIVVDDDQSDSWSHDADVTAADDGTVSDSFDLPTGVAGAFAVTATAPSGTANVSFTVTAPAPPPPPPPPPAPTADPTLSSDEETYAPGATVELTGASWQAGDTIHLAVDDDESDAWDHSADVTAAADGSFTESFALPTGLAATFTATATDPANRSATATFTAVSAPAGTPTLDSDAETYAPGGTVTLSGSDWQAGDSVHVAVNDDKSDAWDHSADITVTADGTISDTFGLPNGLAADFTATATDPANRSATATFSAAFGSATEPYLVRFASGTSTATQGQILAAAGAVDTSYIAPLRIHGVLLPGGAGLQTSLDKLRSYASVTRVEPDRTREAGGTPNDSNYGDQWSLPKIGWDNVFGTVSPSGSAKVAILDTGIDGSHPDLDGNVVSGTSILDGSNGLSDPNGHGTAIAGIIAAETNNGAGVAGVGYAGVQVMPVTVLGADGTGQDSEIIEGVVYAAEHDADVILMAFSNPGYSEMLQAAIDYAWDSGAVLVAATGNDGSSTAAFPAGDRGVIGVSNTDQNDSLNGSSNYGQDVFLGAPGTGIATTSAGGGYTSITGTSAAAAEVAGAAALISAASGASNGVIVSRLAKNAEAAGTQDQTGNGRLNLDRAVADTSTESVQPAGAAPVGGGGPFVGPYVAAATNFGVSWSPTSVAAGSTTDFTFTFTATNGGGGAGTGTLAIPAGWTVPQSGAGAGQVTVAPIGGAVACSAASLNSISGNTITFNHDCQNSRVLAVTYKQATPPGTGVYTFTATPVSGTQPQVAVIDIATYPPAATNSCNTAGGTTTSFTLGAQVCARIIGLGAAGTHRIEWYNSSNVLKDTSANNTTGTLDDTFTPDSTGTWTVKAIRVSGGATVDSATFAITPAGPTKLAFTTSAFTGVYGQCLGPITVQTQNASSVPTNVTSNTTVNLATADAGGFFSDNACTSSITNVSITTGNNSASFFYRAGPVGDGAHQLTASATDLTSASQTQTINPRAITVKADNQSKTFGNPFTFTGSEFSITVGTLAGTDAISGVTLTSAGAAAGASVAGSPYAIVPSAAVFSTGSAGNYAITYANGLLTVIARPITVKADNQSKTFGNPFTFTGSEFSITVGTLAGTDAISGVTLTSAGAAAGASVAGSPYAIVPSAAVFSTGSAGNYAITYANGLLTVIARPITVKADNQSKTFGNPFTFTGSEFSITVGTLAGTDAISGVTLTSAGAAAGASVAGSPYAIVPSAAVFSTGSAGNYAITYANGLLTVIARPITVKADNQSKTFGNPFTFTGSEFSITVGTLAGTDAISGVTLTSAGAAAGASVAGSPYAIVPSAAVFSTGSAGNYAITYANGLLTVIARPITVKADNQSKTFGNPFTFTGSEFSITVGTLAGTDAISGVTLTSAGAAAGASVAGSPYAIVPSAAVFSTGSAGNYAITYANGLLTVIARPITVKADNQSKTFGNPFTFTGSEFSITVGTLAGTDAISGVTLTSAGAAAGASVAGSPYAIVPSAAVFSTGSAGNYAITYANGLLTVIARPITVKADNQSKTFGNPFTFTGSEFSITVGTLAGTDAISGVTLTSAGAAAGASVAGSPYAIVPSAAVFSTGSAGNYAITYANGLLTVIARPITVKADNQSKTFGNPFTFTGSEFSITVGTLAGTDAISGVTLTSAGAAAGASVAGSPYAIVPSAAVFSTGSAGNYAITYANGLLTVIARPITVKADNQSKTFGNPFTFTGSEFSITVGTLAGTDAISGVTLTSAGAAAGASVAGSPYAIVPSAAVFSTGSAGNYAITYANGLLTVIARPITVKADNQSKTFGNPFTFTGSEFSITVGTLAGTDAISGVTLTSAGAAAGASVAGSPYAIVPSAAVFSTGSAGNYAITYANGLLTVIARPITVKADNQSKTFGNPFTFTGSEFSITVGTLAGTDAISGVTLTSAGAAAGASVAGSPYAIVPSAAVFSTGSAGNYAITYANGLLTVIARPITVKADNQSKTFGNPFTFTGSEFSITVGTLAGTDAISGVTLTSAGAAAGASVAGSPYAIVPSAAVFSTGSAGNYAITYANGLLTVIARPITVKADNQSKTFGNPFTFTGSEFSITVGTLAGTDAISGVTLTSAGAAAGASVAGSPYAIVPSAAVFSTGSAGNYAITYANGLLTVIARPITVKADNQSKTFGNPFTFTGSEFSITVGTLAGTDAISGVTLTSAGAAAGASVAGSPYAIVPSAAVFSTGSAGNYAITYANGLLTVIAAATSTTLTITPNSVQYSDMVNLSASVSPTSLAGSSPAGNVQFMKSTNGGTTFSDVGSPVAISGGTASLNNQQVNDAAGTAVQFKAAFTSTSPNFTDSSNTKPLTVTTEDATVAFDAGNPSAQLVSTAGGSLAAGALLPFKVNVTETLPDLAAVAAAAGDINKAGLEVKLDGLGGGGTFTLSCTSPTAGSGYATKTWTCTNPAPLPVDTYDVTATVKGVASGNYYTGVNYDGFTVYDPSLGFATGGGWFLWPGTTDKTNFGFVMKYGRNGTNAKGSLLVMRHHANGTISRLKSNAMGTLALQDVSGCGIATFDGKASYTTWDPTANLGLGGYVTTGGNSFTAYAEDCNNPGAGVDSFWVRSVGNLIMGNPASTSKKQLGGGNIAIPHNSKP